MAQPPPTNLLNKTPLAYFCGMSYAAAVLNGQWKLSILAFLLEKEKLRYSELKKVLVGISERTLIAQLKELVADGLEREDKY